MIKNRNEFLGELMEEILGIKYSSEYPLIIAVDFDGALFESTKFPDFGKPNLRLIEWLKDEKEKGADIILWTCRESDSELKPAVKACEEHGLTFSAVNDNLLRVKKAFGKNQRKIFANIYIDDLAVNVKDVISEINFNRSKLEQ